MNNSTRTNEEIIAEILLVRILEVAEILKLAIKSTDEVSLGSDQG